MNILSWLANRLLIIDWSILIIHKFVWVIKVLCLYNLRLAGSIWDINTGIY